MAFLQCVLCAEQVMKDEWKDIKNTFRSLEPEDKLCFIVNQATSLSYLKLLYHRSLPNLLNDFNEFFNREYMSQLESLNKQLDDKYTSVVDSIIVFYDLFNYSSNIKRTIDADACINLLNKGIDHKRDVIPFATLPSFYTPYLRFLERNMRQMIYVESDVVNNTQSFSVTSASIPSFIVHGRYLIMGHDCSFPNYNYSFRKFHKTIKEYNLPILDIFSYLLGYSFKDVTNISGVLGVLAAQCLERDPNAIPKDSNMWGYYDILTRVLGLTPDVSSSRQMSQARVTQYKLRVIKFISALRKVFDVEIDNREILAKLIDGDVDDYAKQLHSFLVAQKPEDVSVEMYQAFQRSLFSSFGELDIVTKAVGNRSMNLQNKKATAEDEDPDTKGKSKSKDTKGTKTSISTAPKDEENQDDVDETSKVDDFGQDPDESGKEESDTDDTLNDDKDTDSKNKADGKDGDLINNTHTLQIPVPPKVSDKKGVKFELSTGETTDTVLYKLELEQFIDSLLTNPPQYLSVQAIGAIKILRSKWLNLLSVQSSYDILSRIVKVPRNIKPKKEDKL